jgi:tRNA-specific 2-thiouridylase
MSARVLVAMSGGVDSSVAAAILREQGHDVIGVAMRLTGEQPASPVNPRRGTCCSHEDFEDARRVAERMDFPFYVIDLRAEFGARVIGNFVSEYLNGRTPNPCVMCNREIKFDRLWQRAAALDAEFIATGHYARIERDQAGRFHLMRASDQAKDQSYFLFTLGQRELARTLFPLGSMSKSEVRARARALRLANADKPESQEICFVGDGDYAGFLERNAPPAHIRAGTFRDADGHELGRHQGIHRFTVGQRRGLGIAGGEPLYVRSIDAASGEIVVGKRDDLICAGLIAGRVCLTDARLGTVAQASSLYNLGEVEVKIRYRHPPLLASMRMIGQSRAQVRFRDRAPAVTPGQACVFYRGDEVLGGGIIEAGLSQSNDSH